MGGPRLPVFTSLCVCVGVCGYTSVQYISKRSPWIWMKFAKYVEFATQTNRLDFDKDLISGKRILGPYLTFLTFLTLTLLRISELINGT